MGMTGHRWKSLEVIGKIGIRGEASEVRINQWEPTKNTRKHRESLESVGKAWKSLEYSGNHIHTDMRIHRHICTQSAALAADPAPTLHEMRVGAGLKSPGRPNTHPHQDNGQALMCGAAAKKKIHGNRHGTQQLNVLI